MSAGGGGIDHSLSWVQGTCQPWHLGRRRGSRAGTRSGRQTGLSHGASRCKLGRRAPPGRLAQAPLDLGGLSARARPRRQEASTTREAASEPGPGPRSSAAHPAARPARGLTEALPHRGTERVPQEELHLGREDSTVAVPRPPVSQQPGSPKSGPPRRTDTRPRPALRNAERPALGPPAACGYWATPAEPLDDWSRHRLQRSPAYPAASYWAEE